MSVWPGRAMALALLVPALLSLGLFATDRVGPAVLALDAAIVVVLLADLATLAGARHFRAERRCGVVASLGEPQEVELTIENLGRLGRRLRLRDDLPATFAAEPADFLVVAPSRSRAELAYTVVPRRRGTYVLEHVDALVDRGEAREEAVDQAVDDRVQEPARVVDGRVSLHVPLAERR